MPEMAHDWINKSIQFYTYSHKCNDSKETIKLKQQSLSFFLCEMIAKLESKYCTTKPNVLTDRTDLSWR